MGTSTWVWQTADPSARLTDPAEASPPRETTLAAAQASVNFVVFEPEWLPSDCRLAEVTVRPEQPPGRPEGVSAETLGQTPRNAGNPCAIRAVATGDGRRLRVKQFLYDWAPPAASVAPLWRTPEPEPVDCGDAVGWLGVDYKGNRGACLQRGRTQVEVSVLEGAFGDGELVDLLRGLVVAAPERARPVRLTPFHTLNYWLRYQCEPEAVPHGLWNHRPARPFDRSLTAAPFALGDHDVRPLVPASGEFVLDSAAVFPDADAVDCVFRDVRNGSDHLWLTAAGADAPLAPSLPPAPSDQPAETRATIALRGETVHYAALTEAYGAWEAMWAEDGVRYAVWAGASPHLDGERFRTVVEGLEAP